MSRDCRSLRLEEDAEGGRDDWILYSANEAWVGAWLVIVD